MRRVVLALGLIGCARSPAVGAPPSGSVSPDAASPKLAVADAAASPAVAAAPATEGLHLVATAYGVGTAYRLADDSGILVARGFVYRLDPSGRIDPIGDVPAERFSRDWGGLVDAVTSVSGRYPDALWAETIAGHFRSNYTSRTFRFTGGSFREQREQKAGGIIGAVEREPGVLLALRWGAKQVSTFEVLSGKSADLPLIPSGFEFRGVGGRDGHVYAVGAQKEVPTFVAWKPHEKMGLVVKADLPPKSEGDVVTPTLLGASPAEAGTAYVWGHGGYFARFDGTSLIRERAPCERLLRVTASDSGDVLVACDTFPPGAEPPEGAGEPWTAHTVSLHLRKRGGAFNGVALPDLSRAEYAVTPRSVFARDNITGATFAEESPNVLDGETRLVASDGFLTRSGSMWVLARTNAGVDRTFVFHSTKAKEITSLDHAAVVRENTLAPKPVSRGCGTYFLSLGEVSEDAIARAQKDPSLGSTYSNPLLVGRVHEKTRLGVAFIETSYGSALNEAKTASAEAKKRGFSTELFCARPVVERVVPDAPE